MFCFENTARVLHIVLKFPPTRLEYTKKLRYPFIFAYSRCTFQCKYINVRAEELTTKVLNLVRLFRCNISDTFDIRVNKCTKEALLQKI